MIPPRATHTVAELKALEAEGILRLSCKSCGKSYRIRRARIPLTASAVICKGCGKRIRFRKNPFAAAPSRSRGAAVTTTLPRFRFDLMTPEKRPLKRRFPL